MLEVSTTAPRRAAPSSTSLLHRRVGPASWISHRSAQTDSIRCCGLRFAEERKRDEEKRRGYTASEMKGIDQYDEDVVDEDEA